MVDRMVTDRLFRISSEVMLVVVRVYAHPACSQSGQSLAEPHSVPRHTGALGQPRYAVRNATRVDGICHQLAGAWAVF